jgi:hypothetical protein
MGIVMCHDWEVGTRDLVQLAILTLIIGEIRLMGTDPSSGN